MPNTDKLHREPKRAPAQRAEGLEPQYTAQPRPIADEIALEASAEPELSVDPEDLGSRFLRDAIEQGDFDPRARPGDASLAETPAGDRALGSTNFVAGNSVWEQTVDLESRTHGAADQLRAPAPDAEVDAEDLEDAITEVRGGEELRVGDSSVRELSLLDRVNDEGDTVAPEVDLDEQGSHTRRGTSAPVVQTEPRESVRVAKRGSAVRSVLKRSAGMLQRLAERIAR